MHTKALLILLLVVPMLLSAQSEIKIIVNQLNDTLYQLSYDTGRYTVNMLASVGSDGMLLVDTGEKAVAGKLLNSLKALGGKPELILLTHSHQDHTGGIAEVGIESIIVAHPMTRKNMTVGGDYIFKELAENLKPDITIEAPTSIHYNGEEIRLIPMPPSHDNCDLIVLFMESKVALLGDIGMGINFPSYDIGTGNVLKYGEVIDQAIDLIPDDFLVISGHGRNSTVQELHEYRDMIRRSIDMIKTGLAEGKDANTMIADDVLKGFEKYEQGYVSKAEWIKSIVEALSLKQQIKDVGPIMYYAWKERGVQGIIDVYYQYKGNEEYYNGSYNLTFTAAELLRKGDAEGGIALLQLAIKEFPDDEFLWYTYYQLGKAFEQNNNSEEALSAFKDALRLNPDDERIIKKIQQLEASEGTSNEG